jgi:hypothetical protein
MSEQPTPETDAEVTINAINDDGYAVPCVDIEFARKLERERDEARKERDQLKEALIIMENLLKPGIELFPEIGEILKRGAAK